MAEASVSSRPTMGSDAQQPRAVDTNRSYCCRLAEVTVPLLVGVAEEARASSTSAESLQSRAARMPSQNADLPVADLQGIFGKKHPLPPSVFSSAAELSRELESRPDVQARLAVITEYTPSKWLLERELEACGMWPGPAYTPDQPKPDAYEVARERKERRGEKSGATGLCLSGGGIRSATFNLGVLQAFARHRRISKFDYLSSVSGGGYIHQFLANWIYKAGGTDAVEQQLDPIPNEPGPLPVGGNSTVQPEPLRWLRRYSNYLAPRRGMLSLDTWTIVATWVRNTALNFVILLSGLFCLLLLPHFGTLGLSPVRGHPVLQSVFRWILAGFFFSVAYRLNQWLSNLTPPGPRPLYIKLAAASLFGATLLVAPAVYRSTVPGRSAGSEQAKQVFAEQSHPLHVYFKGKWQQELPEDETVEVTVDKKGPESRSRFARGWEHHPRPLWELFWYFGVSIPLFLYSALAGLLFFSVVFVDPAAGRRASEDFDLDPDCEPPMPSPPPRWWNGVLTTAKKAGSGLTLLLGVCLALALIQGIRLVFFAACFLVPSYLIPSLGVMLLPTILFGIPFVIMELGLGLLGRDADSGQREWMARLRAFSFLLGGTWAAFTFFSLFGFHVFNLISRSLTASSTVWGGWLVTTLGGVLSGRSKRTESAAEGAEGASKTNVLLDMVARFAPLVFVAGLLVLISALANWAITLDNNVTSEFRLVLCVIISLVIAVFFGWRIDINDFSMHSFYRDRLARCYGGAVDPNRVANQFTGFTSKDRSLRVHQLLPVGYTRTDVNNCRHAGTYDGPFPIICTAINLTTGEDLAYQERKAGSFAFTPLYSGYNVGFTSTRSIENQFNGFVDTKTYAYPDRGSITFATACAISGAAASPNMGYHTSPAVAFLMTVFNVRLGWWLCNPRRRSIGPITPYEPPALPAKRRILREKGLRIGWLPSSPPFGLLSLIKELMGRANDSAPYVYLTDGGHFDNMGLYELLRRRCRTIVVCDGEEDGSLKFEGIGMAIRKARLDFGVEVTLDGIETVPAPPGASMQHHSFFAAADGEVDLSLRSTDPAAPLNPGPPKGHADSPQPLVVSAQMSSTEAGKITGTIAQQEGAGTVQGLSSFREYPANPIHCVHGTIRYPEDTSSDQFGHILYIKASLTGDEPPDILNYRRQHDNFPHDSTLNQFFTESAFESYRRLGEHIVLSDPTVRSWLQRYID